MELTLATDLASLLTSGSRLSGENRAKGYAGANETTTADSANNFSPFPGHSMARKRKNYYTKLLEMLVRKTESEKRIEIFGSDPFK